MSLSLQITPGGHLRVGLDAENLPAVPGESAAALIEAFGNSSAEGLLLLASPDFAQELPAPLVFWRSLARQFFQAICQLGEGGFEKWKSADAPAQEELAALAADAPPMHGLEYLTAELLQTIWNELRQLACTRAAKHPEGPAGWLRGVNPLWHLLGRVTFHLAENKRDPQRPFAFLATYTHKVSAQARLQHLQLAEALKTYAGVKDRQQLELLLEPVRPDYAGLCKHLAAVLYGVGNRLDTSPELLFTLRNVDHLELVRQAMAEGNLARTLDSGGDSSLAGSDLGEMFGIDLTASEATPKKTGRTKRAIHAKPQKTAVAAPKLRRKAVAKPQPVAVKATGSKPGKAASAGVRRKAR